MAYGIVPKCRYEHGEMYRPLVDPKNKDAKIVPFYSAAIIPGGGVNFGQGYVYELWQCKKCSYIELHDYDPSKEGSGE